MSDPFAALPKRHYRCIMADPAWDFRSYAACQNPASGRHVSRHYKTMPLDDIMALPVRNLASPEGCHLFLWTTGPFLVDGTATKVMRAWGFRPSASGFVWIKLLKRCGAGQYQMITLEELPRFLHQGTGFTTRKNAEFCLLGRRGNARRLAKDVQEVIVAPLREHSRKPDEAFERAERYCAGPFLELFSRESRGGWDHWGNEAGKFDGGIT